MAVVRQIREGAASRTLIFNKPGEPEFELTVPHGYTVVLTC
ncbi:hypothetical protein ACYPKM_02180 [Pseudomonas aeruginosa]